MTLVLLHTERIQQSRRPAHEEDYPSSDEEPDSLARRHRRQAKSYIHSSSAARKQREARRRPLPIEDDTDLGCGESDAPTAQERRPKRTFFRSSLKGVELGSAGTGRLLNEPNALLAGVLANGLGIGAKNGGAEEWRRGVY